MGSFYWITWAGPKCNLTRGFIKESWSEFCEVNVMIETTDWSDARDIKSQEMQMASRGQGSSQRLQKESAPPMPWFKPSEPDFRILVYRTIKEYIYIVLHYHVCGNSNHRKLIIVALYLGSMMEYCKHNLIWNMLRPEIAEI